MLALLNRLNFLKNILKFQLLIFRKKLDQLSLFIKDIPILFRPILKLF